MALVWTAVDGPEGQQVMVQASALGSVRMVLLEMVPGTELPDGTVDAQPLLWSPAGENAWTPGLDMRCNSVSALDDGLLSLVGGSNGAQMSAQGIGSVQLLGPNSGAVTLAADALNMSASPAQRLFLASDATPVFDVNDDGTRPNTIAFLGKAPTVGRQSIDGGTPQAQIDSLVSALTEFGLTQDDRPAAPSLQTQIGWAPNAAGQTSNVLTVLAAGHTPGLYLVAPHVMVRTLQAGSYLSMAATWSNAGAQSITPTGAGAGAALSITSAGMAMNNGTSSIPRTPFCLPIYSDGVSAITVQFTAAGTMAGAALLDVYVAATCLGT